MMNLLITLVLFVMPELYIYGYFSNRRYKQLHRKSLKRDFRETMRARNIARKIATVTNSIKIATTTTINFSSLTPKKSNELKEMKKFYQTLQREDRRKINESNRKAIAREWHQRCNATRSIVVSTTKRVTKISNRTYCLITHYEWLRDMENAIGRRSHSLDLKLAEARGLVILQTKRVSTLQQSWNLILEGAC